MQAAHPLRCPLPLIPTSCSPLVDLLCASPAPPTHSPVLLFIVVPLPLRSCCTPSPLLLCTALCRTALASNSFSFLCKSVLRHYAVSALLLYTCKARVALAAAGSEEAAHSVCPQQAGLAGLWRRLACRFGCTAALQAQRVCWLEEESVPRRWSCLSVDKSIIWALCPHLIKKNKRSIRLLLTISFVRLLLFVSKNIGSGESQYWWLPYWPCRREASMSRRCYYHSKLRGAGT